MAFSEITDLNNLYEAFRASIRGSSWKSEPQRFEIDFLSELTRLQHELENRTYQTLPGTTFIIHERGKVRYIHGKRMRDRVARHVLCDSILTPALRPFLIYNNGASQKGKGIAFTRRMFERDLHNYWLENRTNEGYVGFADLSKFYDNIQHRKIREFVYPKIDETSRWLMDEVLRDFRVDVSYMSDSEFAGCMERKFDSVEYALTVPANLRTGRRYMEKSVDIGDQASQDIGTFFPTPIDNRMKIVEGFPRYGRYMDDMYIIARDKETVKAALDAIIEEAENIGLFINTRKTRICKLSSRFKFLQIRYTLTETGRVVRRINPKTVTRERRKLKAYRRLLDRGAMPYSRIEQSYKSWMGDYTKIMSKTQIKNMSNLYFDLFGRRPKWRK